MRARDNPDDDEGDEREQVDVHDGEKQFRLGSVRGGASSCSSKAVDAAAKDDLLHNRCDDDGHDGQAGNRQITLPPPEIG